MASASSPSPLPSVIKRDGTPIKGKIQAAVQAVEYIDIPLSNANAGGVEYDATPPDGWKVAAASVAGSDLKFDDGSDHQIYGIAVYASLRLDGTALKAKAMVWFTDAGDQKPWDGHVRVQVLYFL